MQFNFVAKYYTFISRVVFGNSLEIAKVSLFNKIPDYGRVLIIGGGTGVSLGFLVKLKPHIKIDFVEVSSKMIALAKARVNNGKTQFVCAPIEKFEGTDYDVIITEFFLDLFTVTEIEKHICLIKQKLSTNGIWIDTDFRPTNKIYDKILLKVMYCFFKLFSKILYSYPFILKTNYKK